MVSIHAPSGRDVLSDRIATNNAMDIRIIQPAEWDMLRPVFEAEGGHMPEPDKATAAVAIDGQGLAGFWTLQRMLQAGPIWIRPDRRRTGLWRPLHARIDQLFEPAPGTGYYTFSGEPKVDTMLAQLNYCELPWKVWKREF
jgi:hypothetical protein